MKKNEQIINDFINEVKNIFGSELIVGYEYCENSEIYNIWHNDIELDFNDDSLAIVDNLIKKHFENFYDFCFAYDFDKSSTLKSKISENGCNEYFMLNKTNLLDLQDYMNFDNEMGLAA